MANAHAVATYILREAGSMSAMKLQKLLYYAQAWSLVWDDEPLFSDRIEAWANGPVVRSVYATHRGQFEVGTSMFEGAAVGQLTAQQKETVDAVLRAYRGKSAQWLIDQTHSETPWKVARMGLQDNDRGEAEITLESMGDFFASLPA